MGSFINKIKNFFNNIFNSKKALPEISFVEDSESKFIDNLHDMVDNSKIDNKELITMIKNRELKLEEKSSEEIKEIELQLDKYLKKIQKDNLNKINTISLYKSKLTAN